MEWIQFSEIQPEPMAYYLTFGPTGNFDVQFYSAGGWGVGHGYPVTHWAYLTKPTN
jgi:hypothetical protein